MIAFIPQPRQEDVDKGNGSSGMERAGWEMKSMQRAPSSTEI